MDYETIVVFQWGDTKIIKTRNRQQYILNNKNVCDDSRDIIERVYDDKIVMISIPRV